MQEGKKTKAYFVNPETQEYFFMGDGEAEIKQTGEKSELKFKFEVTKTQAVLNLLHFAANAGGEEKSQAAKEAARALGVIYANLERLEIVEKEGGGGVTYFWKVKEGLREARADEAVKEVLVLPIVQAAVKHVFQEISKDAEPTDTVKKDGGPLKMSPYIVQARLPERESRTKTTYKKPQIELTPAQSKFERVILRLLRDNSILDKKHPAYLMGNGGEGARAVTVWDEKTGDIMIEQVPYARLLISWADLYKSYADKPAAEISGKERQTIRALLDSMKKELGETVWQKTIEKDDGGNVVRRFTLQSPLIMQATAAELTPEEAAAVDAGGEVPEEKERLLLLLHPAYTFDIAEKSHTLPADYDRRLSKAIGKGGKVKTAHERLFTYLNQIRCGGKTETPANLETLVAIMGLERIRAKQGLPQAKKEIAAGLDIARKIRLIKEYTTTPGAKGQEQYQIIFNPEFIAA